MSPWGGDSESPPHQLRVRSRAPATNIFLSMKKPEMQVLGMIFCHFTVQICIHSCLSRQPLAIDLPLELVTKRMYGA